MPETVLAIFISLVRMFRIYMTIRFEIFKFTLDFLWVDDERIN